MPIDIDKAFAAALSYFLANKPKKSLTQKEVGKRVGLSQSQISKIAKGQSKSEESTRRAIADLYDFEYENFINYGRSLLMAANSKRPDQIPVHGPVKEPPPTVQNESEPSAANQETPEYKPANEKLRPIRQQHVCLIDLFPDQEEAYEINKKLLEIKKADPARWDRVKEYIELQFAQIDAKKIVGENSE